MSDLIPGAMAKAGDQSRGSGAETFNELVELHVCDGVCPHCKRNIDAGMYTYIILHNVYSYMEFYNLGTVNDLYNIVAIPAPTIRRQSISVVLD